MLHSVGSTSVAPPDSVISVTSGISVGLPHPFLFNLRVFMMMIAFITFKSSLVPLFEGL